METSTRIHGTRRGAAERSRVRANKAESIQSRLQIRFLLINLLKKRFGTPVRAIESVTLGTHRAAAPCQRAMRVTLITLMDEGGMVHYTSQLSNHLTQMVDVTVIVPEGCDLAYFSEKVCVRTVKTPPQGGWLNKNNLQVWRLFCAISETEPDVVHLSGSHPWIFPLYLFLKVKRYPVVATVHDVKMHLGEATLVARLTNYVYIRSADHVFVHGVKLRNELVNAGIDDGKVSSIPLGGLLSSTRANAGVEEDGVILFFGRIFPYKGLEYLLDAMPLILKELPYAQLIIAGSGDLAELQQPIQRSL